MRVFTSFKKQPFIFQRIMLCGFRIAYMGLTPEEKKVHLSDTDDQQTPGHTDSDMHWWHHDIYQSSDTANCYTHW